jgi:DNA-directed RNA polymerase specialized sigma24 family protein
MDDLDPREQFQSLTCASRVRIGEAARSLVELANQYDPKLNLKWKALLCKALDIFASKRACGEIVPDLEKFLIATMIRFSDDLIDSYVQQFAVNTTNLTTSERNLHAKEILEHLREAVISGDSQAELILPLMLEGYSGPEIAHKCGLTTDQIDTVKKRIRRRTLTYLRVLLYRKEDNS